MRYGRNYGAGVEHPVFDWRTRRTGIDEDYHDVPYTSVSKEQATIDDSKTHLFLFLGSQYGCGSMHRKNMLQESFQR